MRLIDADAMTVVHFNILNGRNCKTIVSEIIKIINNAPTVDAVPLEPLCEFLAGYADAPVCPEKCMFTDDWRAMNKEGWREYLQGLTRRATDADGSRGVQVPGPARGAV